MGERIGQQTELVLDEWKKDSTMIMDASIIVVQICGWADGEATDEMNVN